MVHKILKWLVSTWKGRIVLVGLGFLLSGHIWLTWRIHRFVNHFCQATIAGTSLKHPDVVFVYDHLLEPLKDELPDGYRITTRPYDVHDFEFCKVTHSAFVATNRQKRGLRLRFDLLRNQFHVVGYWTRAIALYRIQHNVSVNATISYTRKIHWFSYRKYHKVV